MKKILILILILILPIVALGAALFSDGFESGDLTAWDDSATSGGDLSAETTAKLHGNYGLNCLMDDATNMYVQDDTPNAETTYRFRCYIDPNSIYMENNNEFPFMRGQSNGTAIIDVVLKYTDANDYNIYVGIRNDSLGWDYDISQFSVEDTPHCVEVYWIAATGVGNNDGFCELFIDGVSIGSTSTLDTDTLSINLVRVGSPGKGDMGATAGTYFLDDFASNDDGTLIGQIGDNAIFFGTNF